jgi:hypothetical protein
MAFPSSPDKNIIRGHLAYSIYRECLAICGSTDLTIYSIFAGHPGSRFLPLSDTTLTKDTNASLFTSALTMVIAKLDVPATLSTLSKDHSNLPLPSADALGKR